MFFTRKILVFVFVGWQAILLFNCGASEEFESFYRLHPEERERQFVAFPLDKQIDFHLMAMSREPPDYSFSPMIARSGDVIVPRLLKRLRTEQADYRKAD